MADSRGELLTSVLAGVAQVDGEADHPNLWTVHVPIKNGTQSVMVFNVENSPNLVAMSSVEGVSLDALDLRGLRRLLVVASLVPLAKMEALEGFDRPLVTSECAWDGLTAEKLMRRLNAVVELRLQLQKAASKQT